MSKHQPTTHSQFTIHNSQLIILIALTLLALFLRLYQLESVPLGWRDDELINSLVISQKALDGDIRLYYDDASGHEGLYHILNAPFLGIFGGSVPGIRWLSVIMGTLTIPMTYMVGRRMFGREVALLAATALTVSFWSLMYSRTGIRHIALPLFSLPTFYFFLQGIWVNRTAKTAVAGVPTAPPRLQTAYKPFILSGLFLGIGFYTYFASRGVPLILIAFAIYLALIDWPNFRHYWKGILLTHIIALLLAIPLMVVLQQQPEAEARVAELAAPVIEASEGDFSLLWEHIVRTLNMTHSDGDDEYLYNIPFRPLFGPLTAVPFWLGVAMALFYTFRPLITRLKSIPQQSQLDPLAFGSGFLLLWWLAGISPGFLSVPPASLSHTILAQSAVYILWAFPLILVLRWNKSAALLTVLILVALVAYRDLPAYFVEWPSRGNVRLLYRADIHVAADYAIEHDMTDFGISGLMTGAWDREAFEIYLGDHEARPRWYHNQRAIFLNPSTSFFAYPFAENALLFERYETLVAPVGAYRLGRVTDPPPLTADLTCFTNGLCLQTASYDPNTGHLDLTFRVAQPIDLPPIPLISNPPPPNTYAGPRLSVFTHLLDQNEQIIVGDDGLWVDVLTLRTDDVFLQRHILLPKSSAGNQISINIGLYDPKTGQRILTEAGADHYKINIEN